MKSTPYDDVSYPSHAFRQAHPDRLATVATLCGMNPAPVEDCRVLELGCGAGGTLISTAFDLERSEFVGIDLAALPVAEGQELIEALGLRNIRLQQHDLMTLGDGLGQFDYVIAHGLYSWVPEAAQDRILAICRARLTPQGVAYVSYNTYPGCHLRKIARDMMRFHTRDAPDPGQRIAQSRAVVKWVAGAQSVTNAYTTLLREASELLEQTSDGALYHDQLADRNEPVYFHQFAQHAARHGLQFLSEANYFETEAYLFPLAVRQQLQQLATESLLAKEQYLDFLKGRSFRQTLLCHHEVTLDRPPRPERVSGLYLSSSARPVSPAPDIGSDTVEEFRTEHGVAATLRPLIKAALLHLNEIYPRAIRLDGLARRAGAMAGASGDSGAEDALALAEAMLELYGANMIELHTHEPAFSVEPGRFPLASPLARAMARRGDVVTTLRHESLRLADQLGLRLLLLLDGTREREALIDEMAKMIEGKEASWPESLPLQLEQKLAELGRLALLLA